MARDGEAALRAIDKLLQDQPRKVGEDFSEAIRLVTEVRNELIDRHRRAEPDEAGRRRLARLNAVLTVLIAGHYPLGKVPWTHIQNARHSFAAVLAEGDGTRPPG